MYMWGCTFVPSALSKSQQNLRNRETCEGLTPRFSITMPQGSVPQIEHF
jgi:hypothetical protein